MTTQPVARIGDRTSHGGTITGGASKTKCNGQFVARVGDAVSCPIHGATTITSGSATRKAEGAAVARVTSTTSCGATITTGSPNTSVS
jgi:uncharacterized Zn-binding protein involved in type VI secretion